MSLSLKDRVKELTMTTGTGTITLVSAPSGFRRFSSVLSDGDTTYYCIESGSQWEVGIGTYSANTLARTTVLASSNANALINITASRSFVFITYAADKAVYKDGSNRAVIGAAGLIFSDNTVQTTAATTPDLSPYLTISSAAATYITQSSATTLLAAKADLVGGLVPSSQLPSYVDDVVEAANLAAFPGTGETGKIYVAIDTGYTYRWSGSVYIRINEVDLSDYLTISTAASTYLPLAGGTLTGDLKFTDATYDIGKSGATRPRDGFFSRGLGVGDGVNGVYFWAAGTNNRDMYISNAINGSEPQCVIHRVHGISIGSANGAGAINYYNGDISTGTLWGTTRFDSANVFSQRNGLNAQTFRLYGTHTSSTSYELLNIKGKSTASFEIGPENGSAGGTLRGLTLGGYTAGSGTITPWLKFTNAGYATFDSGYVTIKAGIGLIVQTGNIWLDTIGAHAGVRGRRYNGTIESPTAVLNGDLITFHSALGYHSGGALHTTQAGIIAFYATENYTATAQGCKITIGVTPNGTTTNTTVLTLDQDLSATFADTVTIGEYTLPATDGTANQVLQTNGSGVVVWADGGGGGGGGGATASKVLSYLLMGI